MTMENKISTYCGMSTVSFYENDIKIGHVSIMGEVDDAGVKLAEQTFLSFKDKIDELRLSGNNPDVAKSLGMKEIFTDL